MNNLDIQSILFSLPGILVGLTVHEFSHAFAAYKFGDTTAKERGRLTLNPLKHIDPLGFLFILLAGFGWAKPVQFNPNNLHHKKRDEILIALAGPFSNLIIGALFFIVARVLYTGDFFSNTNQGIDVINFLFTSGAINFGLFVFNLIPIPPLDGSHLYLSFLGKTNPALLANLYRYGSLGLFIIIILENKTGIDILPIGKIVLKISKTFINILNF